MDARTAFWIQATVVNAALVAWIAYAAVMTMAVDQYWPLWLYGAYFGFFHLSEFWMIALVTPSKLSLDSFSLSFGASAALYLSHLLFALEFIAEVQIPWMRDIKLNWPTLKLLGMASVYNSDDCRRHNVAWRNPCSFHRDRHGRLQF
jgi:hypothetical protein